MKFLILFLLLMQLLLGECIAQTLLIDKKTWAEMDNEVRALIEKDSLGVHITGYKILHIPLCRYNGNIKKKFNPALVVLNRNLRGKPLTFSLLTDSSWNLIGYVNASWSRDTVPTLKICTSDSSDSSYFAPAISLFRSQRFDYIFHLVVNISDSPQRYWALKKGRSPVIFVETNKGLIQYSLSQYLRYRKGE